MTLAQRTGDHGVVLNGVAAQAKIGQHVPDVFGSLQSPLPFALSTAAERSAPHHADRSQGTKPIWKSADDSRHTAIRTPSI